MIPDMNAHGPRITATETEHAIASLGNKAVGIDGLKDTLIKKINAEGIITDKLTRTFNEW